MTPDFRTDGKTELISYSQGVSSFNNTDDTERTMKVSH